MMQFSTTAAILLSTWLCATVALADGGTLQLSREVGEFRVGVFTSPVVPRVGPVDVSVLLQDATGAARTDVPITVRLEPLADQGLPQETAATTANATNRLFQAAPFDVAQPGPWRVFIAIGTENSAMLSFDLEIAPPLPSWLKLFPWLCWPLVAVALFLVHQCLATRRKTRRNQHISSLHAPREETSLGARGLH